MKKEQIKLSASAFDAILKQLKKIESTSKSAGIKDFPLSRFMMAHADFADEHHPAELRTKRIILQIAGDLESDPNGLEPDIELRTNLLYGSAEYSLLQLRLDLLVKEYKSSAKISSSEVSDCDTVKDCTDLVTSKI